jgi:hypothetical protein
VRIGFRGGLRDTAGRPAHAATFIRQRQIWLDPELLSDVRESQRILTHELFHFVWARMDLASRRRWEALIEAELRRGAAGELGWSAELRKQSLTERKGRRWRDYLCESFCDTAAWYFSPASLPHQEFTLAAAERKRRRHWFDDYLKEPVPILPGGRSARGSAA